MLTKEKKPYDLEHHTRRRPSRTDATPYNLGALGGIRNDKTTVVGNKTGFPEMGKTKQIDTRKKQVKATFIGQDGSLGYTKGKDYVLTIRMAGDMYPAGSIHIERYSTVDELNGDGGCIYGSMIAFLDNWTNIISHNKFTLNNG